MIKAYVGIGSNIGDRKKYIESAIEMLRKSRDIKVDRVSPLYETEPVGGPPQGKFLNGVISIETDSSPRELLNKLRLVEDALGRVRGVKNDPRTIDLDILIFGDVHIEEEDLTIPHPRMNERDFVKEPLNDLLNAR